MTNKFIYIVFASLLSVIIVSCNLLYREVKKRDYIFPENYEGWAAVVFDCKNGVSREEIGEREQLIIPMNGILLCSFKRSKGGIDPNIFILDNGNKIEVHSIEKFEGKKLNDSILYFQGNILSSSFLSSEDLKQISVIYVNISKIDSDVNGEFRTFSKKVGKFLIESKVESN